VKQVCSRCGDEGTVYIPMDMDGEGRRYVCSCDAGKKYWEEHLAKEGEEWHRRMFERK